VKKGRYGEGGNGDTAPTNLSLFGKKMKPSCPVSAFEGKEKFSECRVMDGFA
jgi:hypothetical protein